MQTMTSFCCGCFEDSGIMLKVQENPYRYYCLACAQQRIIALETGVNTIHQALVLFNTGEGYPAALDCLAKFILVTQPLQTLIPKTKETPSS